MGYIKAMRPIMGVFSSFLCWVSLTILAPELVHKHPFRAACLVLAVFFGTCATMVWNDFRDRKHDLKKGKTHADTYCNEYASLSRYLYLACGFMAGWASFNNLIMLIPTIFFLGIASFYYDRTYKSFPMPLVLVSVVSASPVLLALLASDFSRRTVGLGLFLSVALVVGARETIKDIEDAGIDDGYKKTIPTVFGCS